MRKTSFAPLQVVLEPATLKPSMVGEYGLLKEEQKRNQKVCGKAYCREYLGYIYVNELGERVKPGYITQNFALMLKNHGLKKIRFHDLRHSCASLLYANGVSLKEIQEWLGHSDISNAIIAVYPS
jgi:integrase